MSIANLLTENTKPDLNLNVNSLETVNGVTMNYKVYPDLDTNQGVTTDTLTGQLQITTNVPILPAGADIGFTMNNDSITTSSFVGIMPTLTGLTSTDGFAPAIFSIEKVEEGSCRFLFANANPTGMSSFTDNELIFNYYILNSAV